MVNVLERKGSKLKHKTRSQENVFQVWLHYQGDLQNLDKREKDCQLNSKIFLNFI